MMTTPRVLAVCSPLRIEGSLKIYHLEAPLAAQVGQHVVRLETHRAWLNLDRSVAVPEVITNFCEQHWVGCRDLGQWFGCRFHKDHPTICCPQIITVDESLAPIQKKASLFAGVGHGLKTTALP